MGLQNILCMSPVHGGLEKSKDKSQTSATQAKTPDQPASKLLGSGGRLPISGRQNLLKVCVLYVTQ